MAIKTASEPQIARQEGLWARIRARLRSRGLDEALARGTSPETAATLAVRARWLTEPSRRRAIADDIRRVISATCRGTSASQARVSPRRHQVIAASDELSRLANALASPGPVATRGVAQAWILLTDGAGPLYNRNSTANLRECAAGAANHLQL